MRPALVNGAVGLILAPRGRLRRALTFEFGDGKIRAAEITSEPARVRTLDVAVLPRLDSE
jgi:RNA polymerase sigma-70 factor (ECF subfamily)